MTELVIATRNRKKLKELKRYIRSVRVKVISLNDFDGVRGAAKVPEVKEDGATFLANAIKKAETVSRLIGKVVLADDSGLEVKALGGRPGVKSARFAGPAKDDRANCLKVLRLLKGVPSGKRGARFVCAVAVADNGRVVKTIEECCSGAVAFSIRGSYGFGYDPIFLIPRYGRTFGELGPKVKDAMSHRAKALKKAREFLRKFLAVHS
jgi:XTP/dITP diphosphohydrolase